MSQSASAGLVNPAVVDTDVLSFWQKHDTRGPDYSSALRGRTLVIAFQTVAEQLQWAEQGRWGEARRAQLERYLHNFVVYPYTIDLARRWALIKAAAVKSGHPIAAGDAWVASVALLLDAPLATHNRRDFERVGGLQLISFAPTK